MAIPKINKRLSYAVIVAALIVGSGVSIIAYTVMQKWEAQKLWIDFNRAAENRHASLQREIESNMHALESLQGFFAHSEKIGRAEFHDFTRALLLQELSGLEALEWIPRVPYVQREEYEKDARKHGASRFQITEEAAVGSITGNTTGTDKREEYFPVYFVEPYEANKIALGFDLASNPTRKESLENSRDTGEMVATGRGTLVREAPGQHGFTDGFLVFAPIYRKGVLTGSVRSRRENLTGFVLGAFRIGELVEGALAYLESEGVDLYIFDQSAPEGDRLLYFSQSPLHMSTASPMSEEEINSFEGMKYANTLNVAGRQWLLVGVPIPEFLAARKTRLPQGVLGAGFLLTAVFVSYLWVNLRHAEALQRSEEKYKGLFDSTLDGVFQVDANSIFTLMNRAGARIFGYATPEEIIGRPSVEYWRSPEDRATYQAELKIAKSVSAYSIKAKNKNGEPIELESTSHIIEDEKGNFLGIEGILRDVTERCRMEEQLHMLSVRDGLTGLYNRRGLFTLLERQLKMADREKRGLFLLYTDLDNLKMINDTFGHLEGDNVLTAFARVLEETYRQTDIVARIGGDEFVVVPVGFAGDDVGVIAGRLQKNLETYNSERNRSYNLSVSAGVSYYDPENPCSIDELLLRGDTLMYEEKKRKKTS